VSEPPENVRETDRGVECAQHVSKKACMKPLNGGARGGTNWATVAVVLIMVFVAVGILSAVILPFLEEETQRGPNGRIRPVAAELFTARER
jgi:hypothetical protein